MAGEESAATIYRWLDQMKNSSPQILEVFDEFYKQGPNGAAVAAIAKALGFEKPKADDITALDLLDWFKQASGEKSAESTGQILIESAWPDPPAPTPGQKFKLIWEEHNVGGGATGKYKSAIELNGQLYKEVECDSLDKDAKVQRQLEIEGQPEGERSFVFLSPWDGDRNSTLESQAGRLGGFSLVVPIGAGAEAKAEKERQQNEIQGAMGTAMSHLSPLTMGEFDTSNIQYALQAIAHVAPSLDSTMDLMGKAAQMMARDPKTVGPAPWAEAQTKAKDALVALTAAQTRTLLDEANPVDHPDVVNAATLTAAVADVIIAAPVVAATT